MEIKKWLLYSDKDNHSRGQDWWSVIPDDARPAPVPGLIQQVFPDNYGVGIYYASFNPGQGQNESDIPVLAFEAADYFAEVRVNGQYVGSHEGAEFPFSFELKGIVRPNETCNVAVRVFTPPGRDNRKIDDIDFLEIPLGARIHPFYPGVTDNCSGLVSPVTFDWKPAVRATDCHVVADCATGNVTAKLTLRNLTGKAADAKITMTSFRQKDGAQILSSCRTVKLEGEGGETELSVHYDNFSYWDIDDPQLYDVQVLVEYDGIVDAHHVRTGFREFKVQNGFFRLNGRRIFLKCGHIGSVCPASLNATTQPGLLRQDLLMVKASGFNMIRFIAKTATMEQLDLCDELGLMVYEENLTAWWFCKSPTMPSGANYFRTALRDMIMRDRNHPSITIWGLLNENIPEGIFEAAVNSLPLIRSLDKQRAVLLSSGRWDFRPGIGSISNPGSLEWEHVWGIEAPGAEGKADAKDFNPNGGKYFSASGDVHIYMEIPHGVQEKSTIRNLGGCKPVFLSEYGIGSLPDIIGQNRGYEFLHIDPEFSDFKLNLSQEKLLRRDWKRWHLDGVYPHPQAFLIDSARVSARERRRGFDLVRGNPWLCGWNVTSILDYGPGEGLWSVFRYIKPQHMETLQNGWAPLRWCLDITPENTPAGSPIAVEAVLANEDVLRPGKTYTVVFKVSGRGKVYWSRTVDFTWPETGPGGEPPLAMTLLKEELKLQLATGEYTLSAELQHGADARDSWVNFFVTEATERRRPSKAVPFYKWGKFGLEPEAEDLSKRTDFETPALVAVGAFDEPAGKKEWEQLCQGISKGDSVIFFNPKVFISNCYAAEGITFQCLNEEGREIIPPMDFSQAVFREEDGKPDCQMWYVPHFRAMYLQPGKYTVKFDCAEFLHSAPGQRLFDVTVNGESFLKDFDIYAETGANYKHVVKTFEVEVGAEGVIDICTSRLTSVSDISILDADGVCIARANPYLFGLGTKFPIPEGQNCSIYEFHDTLYHKECVLLPHPVFKGMPDCGITENDYWGTLPGHTVWCCAEIEPDETMAVGIDIFSFPVPEGYKAGIMLGRFKLGQGNFYVSTFNFTADNPVAANLFAALLDDVAKHLQ